jgi:exosortase N
LLIYVKPAVSFYSADHSPIICWKGSGYKIVQEQIIEINNQRVYFSELLQNNDHLYTTWWYDCGAEKTISQFKWRTRSLIKGNKYLLVNVIANDKTTLIEKTNDLLKQTNSEN